MKFFTTLLTTAAFSSVNAWFGKGHLLVARIAQDKLEKESPAVLQNALHVLSVLESNDKGWVPKEGKHPFVECATWADDIKHNGGAYQQGWHFIDQPYLDEGGKVPDFNFTYDSHNVTEALANLSDWFNKKGDYQHTYEFEQVMQGMNPRYLAKDQRNGLSIALRLLIHYTGDVHQPLHGSTRLDKEYPQGDRGGNEFPLSNHLGVNELHAVWDSVIYQYTGYADLPYSDQDWDTNGKNSADLVTKHADSLPYDVTNLDFKQWAKESYDVTAAMVYKGIKENEPLPESYIAQATVHAEQRVVTAGLRLANYMKTLNLAIPPKEDLAELFLM